MSYKDRVVEAVKYTESLGLRVGGDLIPFDEKLAIDVKRDVFGLCIEALEYYGYRCSSDLAGKCTPVHLMLQHHINAELGLDSFITIGDRLWDDYIYCEMTKESIERELRDPDLNNSINAHVWLTLTDGSILDCTAEAHADLLFGRGEHAAKNCIMIVEPDKDEDAKSGYHRPILVGSEFLERTGMFQVRSL